MQSGIERGVFRQGRRRPVARCRRRVVRFQQTGGQGPDGARFGQRRGEDVLTERGKLRKLLEIPEQTMKSWLDETPQLAPYRFGIEESYRMQRHVLDEDG